MGGGGSGGGGGGVLLQVPCEMSQVGREDEAGQAATSIGRVNYSCC